MQSAGFLKFLAFAQLLWAAAVLAQDPAGQGAAETPGEGKQGLSCNTVVPQLIKTAGGIRVRVCLLLAANAGLPMSLPPMLLH